MSDECGSPITRTLEERDGLALVLASLDSKEQAAAAAVSHAWATASGTALSGLHNLDLRSAALSLTDDSLIELLKKCPELKSLNAADCKRITDRGIACLVSHCPKLTDLNVACNPSITASGLAQYACSLPHHFLKNRGTQPGSALTILGSLSYHPADLEPEPSRTTP